MASWLIKQMASLAINSDSKKTSIQGLYNKYDENHDYSLNKDELSNFLNGILKKTANKFCKKFDINADSLMKQIDRNEKFGNSDDVISFKELQNFIKDKSGIDLEKNLNKNFGDFIDDYIDGMSEVSKKEK